MSTINSPRDLTGRFGGQGAYTAEAPAPATMFTRLQDTEPNLRAALSVAITQLTGIAAAEEEAPVPAALIAASPGAGKSRLARELLETFAGDTPVVFHAPTLALCKEAADHAREIGGVAHVIRGRFATDRPPPIHSREGTSGPSNSLISSLSKERSAPGGSIRVRNIKRSKRLSSAPCVCL